MTVWAMQTLLSSICSNCSSRIIPFRNNRAFSMMVMSVCCTQCFEYTLWWFVFWLSKHLHILQVKKLLCKNVTRWSLECLGFVFLLWLLFSWSQIQSCCSCVEKERKLWVCILWETWKEAKEEALTSLPSFVFSSTYLHLEISKKRSCWIRSVWFFLEVLLLFDSDSVWSAYYLRRMGNSSVDGNVNIYEKTCLLQHCHFFRSNKRTNAMMQTLLS